MTYSEIYKILSFEKNKIDYKKIIMSTQNNLITIILVVWSNVEPKYNYEQKLQKGQC
jgi:hypothetical protein